MTNQGNKAARGEAVCCQHRRVSPHTHHPSLPKLPRACWRLLGVAGLRKDKSMVACRFGYMALGLLRNCGASEALPRKHPNKLPKLAGARGLSEFATLPARSENFSRNNPWRVPGCL